MTGPRSSTKVTTVSGIQAVVTVRRSRSSVEIVAEAVRSDATEAFDRAYEAELSAYAARVEQSGMRTAGIPPQCGADRHLSEIEILPPEELRGIGRLVRWSGGTGSEWTVRWFWGDCHPKAGWTFEVCTKGRSDLLTLP
ncbi:hypothetical protein GCM10009819_02600 [Agromyces tropicus]|uniref:DUF2203 family protein n=1 Tax=Agromyces tropicus TaxID=555371 RepID=A0ABN2TX16_9MICO